MTISSILLVLVFGVALLDWIAVAKGNKAIVWATKPGVMLLLLAWLWVETRFDGAALWFAGGLLFSLAGDVFLILPKEKFIPALVSFLVANLLYIAGFTRSLSPFSLPNLILALLVALPALQVYRRLRASMTASGHGKLALPVLVYTVIISVMLLSALLTLLNDGWSAGTALLASAGALLFFLSDTLLAWNKFVEPLRNGRLIVRVSYHLGQILITLAAAQQFA